MSREEIRRKKCGCWSRTYQLGDNMILDEAPCAEHSKLKLAADWVWMAQINNLDLGRFRCDGSYMMPTTKKPCDKSVRCPCHEGLIEERTRHAQTEAHLRGQDASLSEALRQLIEARRERDQALSLSGVATPQAYDLKTLRVIFEGVEYATPREALEVAGSLIAAVTRQRDEAILKANRANSELIIVKDDREQIQHKLNGAKAYLARMQADWKKDYDGMRDMQAKFIRADHELRDLKEAHEKLQVDNRTLLAANANKSELFTENQRLIARADSLKEQLIEARKNADAERVSKEYFKRELEAARAMEPKPSNPNGWEIGANRWVQDGVIYDSPGACIEHFKQQVLERDEMLGEYRDQLDKQREQLEVASKARDYYKSELLAAREHVSQLHARACRDSVALEDADALLEAAKKDREEAKKVLAQRNELHVSLQEALGGSIQRCRCGRWVPATWALPFCGNPDKPGVKCTDCYDSPLIEKKKR